MDLRHILLLEEQARQLLLTCHAQVHVHAPLRVAVRQCGAAAWPLQQEAGALQRTDVDGRQWLVGVCGTRRRAVGACGRRVRVHVCGKGRQRTACRHGRAVVCELRRRCQQRGIAGTEVSQPSCEAVLVCLDQIVAGLLHLGRRLRRLLGGIYLRWSLRHRPHPRAPLGGGSGSVSERSHAIAVSSAEGGNADQPACPSYSLLHSSSCLAMAVEHSAGQ